MTEYRMTLTDRQRIARDTMAFWFDANGARYEFRAGQHADFVFGNESDNSRTFSLAVAIVPTVTGHKTLAWPYEKGRINREMLTRHLLGLNRPIYYIAGPSGMVTAMSELLKSSGVNEDDMRTEEFGDYKISQDSAHADQTTGNSRSDSAL
jgi:ferredoxin-NADP reductase